MPAPRPEARLARNVSASWRVIEGEAVILLPEAGTLHRLNATGTAVWERIDGSHSLHDVAESMAAEYDVDTADASHDIRALAEDLIAAGLAKVCR